MEVSLYLSSPLDSRSTSLLCQGQTVTLVAVGLMVIAVVHVILVVQVFKLYKRADGFQYYAVKLILKKNDERNVQCNQDCG